MRVEVQQTVVLRLQTNVKYSNEISIAKRQGLSRRSTRSTARTLRPHSIAKLQNLSTKCHKLEDCARFCKQTKLTMGDLESALKHLPKLVRQREEGLLKREKELKRLQASLEAEHSNMGEPSDVLQLNVGGSCISVLRRTLTQVEGSMLASRFSGRWDESLEKDGEARFFIDQPIDLFLLMINYLRALASATLVAGPPSPPNFTKDRKCEKDFFRMVEYYGMAPGLYPMGIYRLDSAGNTTLIACHPNFEIETNEFETFCLLPLRGSDSQGPSFQDHFGL